MANKIVDFFGSVQTKSNKQFKKRNEVYLDLSMISEKRSNSGHKEKLLFTEMEHINDQQKGIHIEQEEFNMISLNTRPKEVGKYKVQKDVNVKAVQNSLHNIFTWRLGERILLPQFGNSLYKYLYEGILPHNVEQIIAEIKAVTSIWEPRIRIIDIINASTINDTEDNTVLLDIVYVIPGLSEEQFTYSIKRK